MRPSGPLALLVVALLAGCLQGHPPGSPATTSAPGDAEGERAMSFVRGLALQPDGTPRYRIPGSPGQREGASYLWNATSVPGWERHFENFTGADYLGLDRSRVAAYGAGSRFCPAAWEERLPGLTFANLLATRPAADPAAPILVLGAHWDSQPESNFDPDPANRSLPDPGANDGASGVGVLLGLMRALSGKDLPFTIRMLFTDGEDGFFACYPLAGSLWHVQQGDAFDVQGLGRKESAFILLDMVGDPGALFPRESYSAQSFPRLVDHIWRHGQRAGTHFIDTAVPIEDDHIAYIDAGIRAIDIIDAGRPTTFPPQWDTRADTVDRISAATLGEVSRVLLASLTDPALPAVLA